MIIKRLLRLLPFVAMLWTLPVPALTVSGLYSAELEVQQLDQAPSPEQTARGLPRFWSSSAGSGTRRLCRATPRSSSRRRCC
ncbi:hypothetical protein [Marinobacterium aestuariivivens]|uniref:Uncharacterized protein n=1 Tax=Marinobacterium aestuariivivens TaxID=1698799 RepID=A0ABW2A4Z1_9GAMM